MAIDLTVSLTDAEQALVQELALRVAPGATQPQIKAWAEKQAKMGLRAVVVQRLNEAQMEDNNAALAAKRDRVEIEFPNVSVT